MMFEFHVILSAWNIFFKPLKYIKSFLARRPCKAQATGLNLLTSESEQNLHSVGPNDDLFLRNNWKKLCNPYVDFCVFFYENITFCNKILGL